MFYITGDTHGEFDRIEEFCNDYCTSQDDVMIILGDAGINYYLDERDERLKDDLVQLPITLFCIHGNHEERPEEIGTYEEVEWNGGIVYMEPEYPNILFAKDGEIYNFGERTGIVIGGAYSVDKYYRLAKGLPWFDTEQPTEDTKAYVIKQLDKVDWGVDYVFTHTVPEFYEPTWAYLPTIDQSTVDKSTEKWLDEIERKLNYEHWYAGHWHVEHQEARVRMMFEEIEELADYEDGDGLY
ncbi:MAG: metallophosphoesterase [Lachnospiraceae bacterium]|nr:metallophosphoesterase [Lachnospiraceae bacterium]